MPDRSSIPDAATAIGDRPSAPSDEETAQLLGVPTAYEPPSQRPATKNLTLPRRWESLLVDAAVIGGAARWHRRLDALDRSLEKRIERSIDFERLALERERDSLRELRRFALPIIDFLGELPEAAPWGRWLEALSELTERTVDAPEPILSVLAQLAIVKDVGAGESERRARAASRTLGRSQPSLELEPGW